MALGRWLAENQFPTAMMDISDGLSSDLARLCEASGVGAVISNDALPGPAGVSRKEAARLALHGGDDYELLFTLPTSELRRFERNCPNRQFRGVPISCVGTITKQCKLLLVTERGAATELSPGGWDPFRK